MVSMGEHIDSGAAALATFRNRRRPFNADELALLRSMIQCDPLGSGDPVTAPRTAGADDSRISTVFRSSRPQQQVPGIGVVAPFGGCRG